MVSERAYAIATFQAGLIPATAIQKYLKTDVEKEQAMNHLRKKLLLEGLEELFRRRIVRWWMKPEKKAKRICEQALIEQMTDEVVQWNPSI